MPTLCLIADTHRRHRELTIPPCDILIHAGDMCSFRKDDLGTLADVDDWFASLPARHIVCVAGNHDFPMEDQSFTFQHATELRDQHIELEGLKLYGSPWCPFLAGFAHYRDDDGLIEAWTRIPTGLDILITHTPPEGILDMPSDGKTHLGCEHLSQALARTLPRLHVFGHIHASHGTYATPQTTYINAAIVGGPNLEVRHQPTVIVI
jgi:Icc-related predicted phosphoesterase